MKPVINKLEDYEDALHKEELAPATISKYISDAAAFISWADGRDICKGLTIEYKDYITGKWATSTANNKIITLNKYLKFLGLEDCTVKNIQIQPAGLDNVLSDNDYARMLRQAEGKGTHRDYLMLEALYRTGIRVSELEFFTVEALKAGYMNVDNKGKLRKVPISKTLEKQARAYLKEAGITSGPIIVNRNGEPLGRSYIFKRIKYLAGQARIKKAKAYPHSIRHLFAKNYLARNGQNAAIQLADILGHSSLETTKIYVRLSVEEARATMD